MNYRACSICHARPNAANFTMQYLRLVLVPDLICTHTAVIPSLQTYPKVLLQTPPLRPALVWARLVHWFKVKVAHELAHKLEHLHRSKVAANTDPRSISELHSQDMLAILCLLVRSIRLLGQSRTDLDRGGRKVQLTVTLYFSILRWRSLFTVFPSTSSPAGIQR